MEAMIAKKLYDNKYRKLISFESYSELLEKGLQLITQNRMNKTCKSNELKALEIALEYTTEATLAHL